MIWDNFSIFRTNCAIACGTRAYIAARIFAMSRRVNGVQNSRNRLCFWPTTQRLLTSGILSIFFVSCSSLSEDSVEFRYVPIFIADQVEFRCSFYKNFTLLQSIFYSHVKIIQQLFHNTEKKTSWICLDIAAFRPNK